MKLAQVGERLRSTFPGAAPWGRMVLVAALPVALGGCPDPDGEFAAFGERYPKETTTTLTNTGGGAPCGEDVTQDIEGDFLLALSAKLARTKPIVFKTELATTDAGFTMTLDALKIDRKTPMGTPKTFGPFPIAADGAFQAEISIAVDGAANPITVGSGITATATLDGWMCADFVCGDVSGQATTDSGLNVNLAGSTFTIDRANDDGTYAEPPQINCAGDLAKPVSEI